MTSELLSNSPFNAQEASRDELLAELARCQEEIEHLRGALDSNRQIGAATGILMALRGVTQQQAFDLLRQASQHTHQKLRDIAAEVLLTGVLPQLRAQ